MTRQLVDVIPVASGTVAQLEATAIVMSLLTDGPAEHTIVCPTCEGTGYVTVTSIVTKAHTNPHRTRCSGCTDGQRVIIIRAEVKQR